MITDDELQYSISFNDIMVKLHLAAVKSMAASIQDQVYNTGIVKMNSSSTVQDPNGAFFDIVKDQVYSVGICTGDCDVDVVHSFNEVRVEKERVRISSPGSRYKQMLEENAVKIEESIKTQKTRALKLLQHYMSVFIGKNKASSIELDSVRCIALDDKVTSSSSISEYKDFNLPGAELIQKMYQLMSEDVDNKSFTCKKLCYAISFKLEKEQ